MPTTVTAITTTPTVKVIGAEEKRLSVAKPPVVRRQALRNTPESFDKNKRHPWERRKALSEDYEEPISGRESWWRTYIRETPLPGAYESGSWLVELDKKPHTYRFKSDGRKIDPHPHGKGAVLLPGAYNHRDWVESMSKGKKTYSFKAIERESSDFLNFGIKDKDINVSPDAYGVEHYLTCSVEKQPSKHPMFKSQSRRFPTNQFKPKDGPAPGNYEVPVSAKSQTISSSFKSKTPRFSSSHTRVPGPGSYEATFQHPMAKTVARMGRQHGLFFSSAFQA